MGEEKSKGYRETARERLWPPIFGVTSISLFGSLRTHETLINDPGGFQFVNRVTVTPQSFPARLLLHRIRWFAQ